MAAPRRKNQIKFHWEGKDKRGKVVSGEMQAANEASIRLDLRRQGISATKIRKLGTVKSGEKISSKDVALFTRQMATMLKSGVPLIQSFDIVGKGASNAAMGDLLLQIKSDVETGAPLAQAFRKHPLIFDQLYCDLIEAGEQGGILDQLLDRLADYLEKTMELVSKIKSAMFYPVAVLVVGFIVTAIIMIFVVPQFKQVFADFGAELPTPTLVVMSISDFFVEYWYLIFGAIGGGIYMFLYTWKRSTPLQIFMDRLLLRLPVMGDLVRKSALARWTRTLSTMFSAGIPLVEALGSVGGASGNYVYREATKHVKRSISTGTSLAAAMASTDVFPPMVVQMIGIGEETGQLDTMSGKVADYFDNEVNDAVKAMLSLMEPMIMVVLGVLLGGIIVAMYLPIFKLGSVI